jgi:cytochrome P450
MQQSESNASLAEFRAAREPTGPAPVSILSVLRGRHEDPYARWTRIRREHGDVAHYRYGISNTFFVSSADGVERVLKENTANYTKDHSAYRALRRLFGNGLFTSEGSFWLRQRRLAQPAFHRQKIAAMAAQMIAAALNTRDFWDRCAASETPVSIIHEMSKLTLRIVGDALFGAALAEKSAQVSAAWDTLNQQLVERFGNLRLLPPILPTRYDREFRSARRSLFGVVDGIIAERRKSGTEHNDLLSMFMHAEDEDTGERMTDSQLRDEVVTMLLAGHETTAITLAWTFALLDNHPQATRRLQEELDSVLGERPPTAEDIPRLPFTRAVISETLRLYAPAYILNRHIVADDVISGYRVYKGGSITISPLILHRHPAYWESPEDFLPERWLDPEAEKRRPRFAYMPFSGGPRQCIGNNFSLMESVLILATLAQRFHAKLVTPGMPPPQYLVLMRPKGEVMAMPKRR